MNAPEPWDNTWEVLALLSDCLDCRDCPDSLDCVDCLNFLPPNQEMNANWDEKYAALALLQKDEILDSYNITQVPKP